MKLVVSLIALALVSACVTIKPELGTNTLSAKENLNTCVNDAFFDAVVAAGPNPSADPRKEVAIKSIRSCDARFVILERSLVADGEDPQAAISITDKTKLQFYNHLIRVMNTDWSPVLEAAQRKTT